MPHINYCLPIYGTGKGVSRLGTYMKWGIRVCNNLKYNSHTNKYFQYYKILKFEDQFTLQILLLGYKFITGSLTSNYYNSDLTFHEEKNRRKNIFDKIMPNHKTKNTIFETLPAVWNSRTPVIEKSLKIFKAKFKERCFTSYSKITCTKKKCYSCGTMN